MVHQEAWFIRKHGPSGSKVHQIAWSIKKHGPSGSMVHQLCPDTALSPSSLHCALSFVQCLRCSCSISSCLMNAWRHSTDCNQSKCAICSALRRLEVLLRPTKRRILITSNSLVMMSLIGFMPFIGYQQRWFWCSMGGESKQGNYSCPASVYPKCSREQHPGDNERYQLYPYKDPWPY